eukprot:jgi/Ulvmu1/11448/UM076_0022.1
MIRTSVFYHLVEHTSVTYLHVPGRLAGTEAPQQIGTSTQLQGVAYYTIVRLRGYLGVCTCRNAQRERLLSAHTSSANSQHTSILMPHIWSQHSRCSMHSGVSRFGEAVTLCTLYALLATAPQLSAAHPASDAAGTTAANSTKARPPSISGKRDLNETAASLESSRSTSGLSDAFTCTFGSPGNPNIVTNDGPDNLFQVVADADCYGPYTYYSDGYAMHYAANGDLLWREETPGNGNAGTWLYECDYDHHDASAWGPTSFAHSARTVLLGAAGAAAVGMLIA